MENLKLEHLAPYLPYGLKFIMTSDYTDEFCFEDWDGKEEDYKNGAIWQYAGEIDNDLYIPLSISEGEIGRVFRKESTWISINNKGIKPILRPLSDLTKEIEVNGELLIPTSYLLESTGFEIIDYKDSIDDISELPYNIISKLCEWHFDIFSLLEKKLAIDINTL